MKILIPTHHREMQQKCYKSLPPSIRSRSYLCARTDRVAILQRFNPDANVIDIGETDGIADVRQRLLDAHPGEKVFIVDDSTTFRKRENGKLVPMNTTADYESMLQTVEHALDRYAWVGISDQGGNNRVPEDYVEIHRSYSCYGINAAKFTELGVRFDGMWRKNKEIKLFEDFYALLSLLAKGRKNVVYYKWAIQHAHGKPGGNSLFRTSALQEKCLRALEREFPGYIKFVRKQNPSWTADKHADERFEAVIQWKKVYQAAVTST